MKEQRDDTGGRPLSWEDGLKALAVHAQEKGFRLREKYGNFLDYETLVRILNDREFTRYPTEIVFDSSRIEEGLFAVTERKGKCAEEGYVIYVHEYFQRRTGDLALAVLYHLVTVNYGDFATYNEAEEFGSAALGMDKEMYYQNLCRIADTIAGERA